MNSQLFSGQSIRKPPKTVVSFMFVDISVCKMSTLNKQWQRLSVYEYHTHRSHDKKTASDRSVYAKSKQTNQ